MMKRKGTKGQRHRGKRQKIKIVTECTGLNPCKSCKSCLKKEADVAQYSEEQVQEMISEAVDKTEKSFGGTFKRLKSENEELREKYESAMMEFENEKAANDSRMKDLDRELITQRVENSQMKVQNEIQKQLGEKGPIPERFINLDEIEYSEDPEELSTRVSETLEKGKKEFEEALQEAGLTISQENRAAVNPTNPASRDQRTARDLKAAGAKEALRDMARRGLIR
jgi:hypothetical protein